MGFSEVVESVEELKSRQGRLLFFFCGISITTAIETCYLSFYYNEAHQYLIQVDPTSIYF